jgi:hypothetical protein
VERKKSRKGDTRKWWCGMAGMVLLLLFNRLEKKLEQATRM